MAKDPSIQGSGKAPFGVGAKGNPGRGSWAKGSQPASGQHFTTRPTSGMGPAGRTRDPDTQGRSGRSPHTGSQMAAKAPHITSHTSKTR